MSLSQVSLAHLIVIVRVHEKRPKTSSLKLYMRPSLYSRELRPLLTKGCIEEMIDRVDHSWRVIPSEKGKRVAAEASASRIIMDLYETAELSLITSLLLNMTIEELTELLVHREGLLRNWARERISVLRN